MIRLLLIYLFAFIFCLVPYVFANIIYVPGDTTSIQGGINLASNGDTVLVDDGTYYENINFKGKAITVASNFIMDGDTNHINSTIIDGSQPSHPDSGSVVYFVSGEDTTSRLSGFTITAGTGTRIYVGAWLRPGGGIYIRESSAFILKNKIVNNNINHSYPLGGGIFSWAYLTEGNISIIRDNEISMNSVIGTFPGGGGIYLAGGGYQTGGECMNYIIEKNFISNNNVNCTSSWKAMGGGIMHDYSLPYSGTMIIRNNVIKGNEVHCINPDNSFGGGIYIVYFQENPVIDNEPDPLIYNNLIINNYSSGKGGAVAVFIHSAGSNLPIPGTELVPQPVLINNTIVNNKANDGYAFFIMNTVLLSLNNIIWNKPVSIAGGEVYLGNLNNTPVGNWTNLYGDIEIYYSDIRDTAWVDSSKGTFNADPMFADTINYELSDASPCIGSGKDSIFVDSLWLWYTIPTTCYLGHPRPSPTGSNPDIGACESPLALPTGLQQFTNNISLRYQLHQNYPNPFNPNTTIEFDLPKSGEVTLKVFNILGEEVVTLVSDRLSAGSYSYEWSRTGGIASGIYLYRLEAEGFVQTRKMILMK